MPYKLVRLEFLSVFLLTHSQYLYTLLMGKILNFLILKNNFKFLNIILILYIVVYAFGIYFFCNNIIILLEKIPKKAKNIHTFAEKIIHF